MTLSFGSHLFFVLSEKRNEDFEKIAKISVFSINVLGFRVVLGKSCQCDKLFLLTFFLCTLEFDISTPECAHACMQVNMCVAICVYVSMLTPCPSAKLTDRWIKVKLRPRDALCTLHRNSHNPLFFLLVQSSSPSYEPPPHFHHAPLFILPCPRHGP